jgi:TonB family protein
MAPVTKEPEILSSTQSSTGATPPAGGKAQPAAAEIPVTVNGARSVEGTDRREPFSEKTQTVLVFANGGVIRLSSPVSSGQLLFLTNEKSRKEVVCQVVKSKNYSSVSGYVELEFTEAAPGFWGIRFPAGETPASAPAAAKPLPTIATPKIVPPSAKPVEDATAKTNRTKAAAPVSPNTISPAVTPTAPPRSTQLPQQSPAIAADKRTDSKPGPVATEQALSAVPKIPTLSEFLTHSESGPELKPERVKPVAPPEAKLDAAAKTARDADQKESLTSLLVPAAANANPAPGTYTFDFAADEVKIPAWLEPLARNSSTISAPSERKIPATHDLDAKAPDTKVADTREIAAAPAESLTSDSDSDEHRQFESHSKEHAAQDSDRQAVFTIAADGPTPNFGSSLVLDDRSGQAEVGSKGSGGGLKFGLLAAGLVLAVSAGWYWYSNQQQSVAASATAAAPAGSGTTAANTPSLPAPNTWSSNAASSNGSPSNGTLSQPGKPALPTDAVNLDANRRATKAETIRTDGKEFLTTPNGTSKPAAINANVETVSPPEKKPALGHVRLAPPVVGKRGLSPSSNDDNIVADSAPSLGGSAIAAADSSGVNLLGTKSNQPAAPITVGGDVKPARLLSSVAPAYPQMARNQRIGGDVKIDALIDASGRVSATKIISGPALLHQAAQDAVRQWKYQPATLNGQPAPMHLTVTVQFKLQ